MPERRAVLDDAQEELLALLRTKGLSIRGLDGPKREQLRAFLDCLHNARGVSLTDVAKLVGNKTSGYVSWVCRELEVRRRPFEEARLKGIREKRRKYDRRPFDGTEEDRAYLLGVRHGDFSAYMPFKGAVRVSTSTTHPAMAQLFHSLFEPYGHIYQAPRFKKDTKTYEWNLQTVVDDSFAFLLNPFPALSDWIISKPSTTRAYLAGLLDAEGSIGIYPSRSLTSLMIVFYNTNLDLMWFVYNAIKGLGFRPLQPYMDKKKGFRSPGYRIEMKKDYWRVMIARFKECQEFVRGLPVRHAEKVEKKALAVSLFLGERWTESGPRVESIRAKIRLSRDTFVAEAESALAAKREYGRLPPSALLQRPSSLTAG